MSSDLWALAFVLLLVGVPAFAQTAPADAAKSSAATAAAAASAAMDRARRQAEGPMRVILESSRPRRKAADAEAAAAADAAPARAANRREAPSLPLAPPSTAPAAPAADQATQAGPVAEITLNSPLSQGKEANPVPALQTGAALATLPLSSGPMALPGLAAGPVRPKLVSQLDPEVPQEVLDELGRNIVVPADITIRADGSVAAVTLVGNWPRLLRRAVLLALEQWRFEPLPSERGHRVELVFNVER